MRSIRLNFIILSAIIISAVLVLAAFIFLTLFSQNLERRVHEELKNYVNQLAADLQFSPSGELLAPTGLSDLRFEKAYSGLYWQIEDQKIGVQLRSKSLWDTVLPLPDDVHDVATVHHYVLPGPDNTNVIVQERALVVAAPNGSRMIRLAAAMDQSVISTARNQFFADMIPYLLALGFLLLMGTLLQVMIGLRPLDRVAASLDDVKNRRKKRLEGNFPMELSRLTDAVNDLLKSQGEALDRARKRSGDLAHSLKTPLTAIRTNAERLTQNGEDTLGEEIIKLTMQMEANIKHELLRSKLAPTPNARKSDADAVSLINDVVRTLKSVPSVEKITWDITLPDKCMIAMDPHDLREMLGNVIENSSKWAASKVVIVGRCPKPATYFELIIEDDGPGIDAAQISSMMERGKRFDETTPGTGIGLSIVKEIADLYEIPIAIQNRQSQGLSVNLKLPLILADAP